MIENVEKPIREGVRPELIPTVEDFNKALDVAEERLARHEESPFMTSEGLQQYQHELLEALVGLPFEGAHVDAVEARYDKVRDRIEAARANLERKEES